MESWDVERVTRRSFGSGRFPNPDRCVRIVNWKRFSFAGDKQADSFLRICFAQDAKRVASGLDRVGITVFGRGWLVLPFG